MNLQDDQNREEERKSPEPPMRTGKLGKSTTEKRRRVHAGDDDQANSKRQRATRDLLEQHSPLGVDAGQDFGGSYILPTKPGTFTDCHNDILQFQMVDLPHLSVSMPNLCRFYSSAKPGAASGQQTTSSNPTLVDRTATISMPTLPSFAQAMKQRSRTTPSHIKPRKY